MYHRRIWGTLALWLCSLELCHIFFFLFFVYFSFPKFHPSVLLSSLFLYLLYKGHHWIPWTRLLTRVHKFDFLCQLATVFSSVYQLTCMDLPNLLNPNKSQTEFIFPKSFLSSCLLLENFIIHQNVKYQNLLFFCSSSVQFGSVQSLSHVWLFVTSWTAARQASLSITNSWSLLKLMSIESAMPLNHLILCYPPPPLAFNLSQHQSLFQWISSSHQMAKVLEFQLQHQSFQWTPRTDFL